MGGGWLGGGWQGGGWQGGGWQGGGWQGGGWQGGPDGQTYPTRADRPLAFEDVSPDYQANPKYPLTAWDPDLFALHFLPDFFTAKVAPTGGGAAQSWNQFITVTTPMPQVFPPGQTGDPEKADYIDDLRNLAVTERPEAMGEILDQNQNQQLCFMHLLMMTQTSHPKTFFLMKVAARVGEAVMIRLKGQYNRPRPTQYYPCLYPPVPVPAHASFPAGHALIATLTAKVLIEVTKSATRSPYEKSLLKLAERIGFNRVIAGLHFRSDIRAGNEAGGKTFDFLQRMTTPNPVPAAPWFNYAQLVTAAKAEWAAQVGP